MASVALVMITLPTLSNRCSRRAGPTSIGAAASLLADSRRACDFDPIDVRPARCSSQSSDLAGQSREPVGRGDEILPLLRGPLRSRRLACAPAGPASSSAGLSGFSTIRGRATAAIVAA